MRQRKAKDLEQRFAKLSDYIINEPTKARGQWNQLFHRDHPIYLELGCGKGKFLIEQAQSNPDVNYIGIEGQPSVILRAIEQAKDLEIFNLLFVPYFVRDIRDYFIDSELEGIFLNFSDPWPKARHAKRRLTHVSYLNGYHDVINDTGFIQIKTDNEDLFSFTLEEIAKTNFEVKEISSDLHNSIYMAGNITTEYEDRFHARGENIYYIKTKRG